MTWIDGLTFEREKPPLQQLHSRKGNGLIYEGGSIFEFTVLVLIGIR